MKISKIKDVKTPERGTERSAGIDFFVPNDFKAELLLAGKHIKIGSGIRAEIPSGYMLCAFNKSGVALAGLSVGACVIDEDYQGEISLHLFNETDGNIEIKPGQKLVQFILIPIFYDTIDIVDDSDIHKEATDRGAGGFGSTGNGLELSDLSLQVKNVLKLVGVQTIKGLLEFKRENLLKTRNCGKDSINEIDRFLKKQGIKKW